MWSRTIASTFAFIGFLFVAMAAIGSFGAWEPLAVIRGIAIGLWFLLFGFLLLRGTKQPQWQSAKTAQYVVLIWSWFWSASALTVISFEWIKLTWQVTHGLEVIPEWTDVDVWLLYFSAVFMGAVLQLIGWFPKRIVIGKHTEKSFPEVPLTPSPAESANSLQTETRPDSDIGVSSTTAGGPYDIAIPHTSSNGTPLGARSADTLWLAGSLIYWIGVLVAAVFAVLIFVLARVDPSSAGISGFSFLLLFAALFYGAGWASRYGLRGFALKGYLRAAREGDARAQNKLGSIYQKGQPVVRDAAEAIAWCRNAAEQGVANAQYELGRRYETGQDMPQDIAKATEWYVRAAEQGATRARRCLAKMYEEGRCVPDNNETAAHWHHHLARRRENKRLVLSRAFFFGLVPLVFFLYVVIYSAIAFFGMWRYLSNPELILFMMSIAISSPALLIYFMVHNLLNKAPSKFQLPARFLLVFLLFFIPSLLI